MIIKSFGSLDTHRTTTTTSSTSTTSTTTIAGSLPPLEGYGALVTGHLGGPSFTTYTVTNTNASGAGSLANGIASNRRIIFSVSGTITLPFIEIQSTTNLTIDGTTAPYPGITITANAGGGGRAGITIQSGSNILVTGLAFVNCTANDGSGSDGLNVADTAHDVAVTHCIAYGNHDGNIDFASDSFNCTMQYCIIGNHSSPVDDGAGGTLVTGNRVTIHHNLFFPISPNPEEGERFPFVHRNYGTAAPNPQPDCDIRNNLVYKFGRSNGTGSGFGSGSGYNAKVNVVNNYYYTTGAAAADGVDSTIDGTTSQMYSAGNVSGNGLNFNVTSGQYNNHVEFAVPAQFQITMDSACAAAQKILQYAGPTQRNPIGGGRPPTHQAYIDGVSLPLPGC